MTNKEFETILKQVLEQKDSLPSEDFREDLLKRCLAVLNADCMAEEISDEQIELLSAAGDPWQNVYHF